MWSQRAVIDYSLARRAKLAELFAGRASTVDVCDAHPYLLRAAKYHGEATERPCPVCEHVLRRRRGGAVAKGAADQAVRRPGRNAAATGAGPADAGRERLTQVTYVFGDELGQYSGRVKTTPELEDMAHEYGEFRVYVVEVCQSCSWNHLTVSYVLGDGVPRRTRRRTAEE